MRGQPSTSAWPGGVVQAGLATAVTLAVGALAWWFQSRRLRRNVLSVQRLTEPERLSRGPFSKDQAVLNLLRFMDLDEEAIGQEPFSQTDLMSLADYFRSLRIPGNFDWRRAVNTLLVHTGLAVLLPATGFIMKPSATAAGADPLAILGGSEMAYIVLREALSPLQLYATSELMHLSQVHSATEEVMNHCVASYIAGHQSIPKALRSLPNPFVLTEHLQQLLEGLDPDAAPPLVEGRPGVGWLPDLAFESLGLSMKENKREALSNQVMAMLFNKLAANALPGAWRPPGADNQRHMTVQLRPGSQLVTSPEELIAELHREPGAEVFMQLVTRITSFGIGMAVKEGDQWKQAPFAIPVRTGVVMLHGVAESSGTSEITSLMSHAEVALRARVPGVASFRVSWYQGIEGFTGWHPASEVSRPWNNSRAVEPVHSAWATAEARRVAMAVTSAVAAITNAAADRVKLPHGGYGYLGVCCDSAAAVQAALGEPVSVFPCILAGHGKAVMLQLYKEFAELHAAAGNEALADLGYRIRRSMHRLPCDVVHEPATMLAASRRIAACIPAVTPFRVLKEARRDLEALQRQYGAEGILERPEGACFKSSRLEAMDGGAWGTGAAP